MPKDSKNVYKKKSKGNELNFLFPLGGQARCQQLYVTIVCNVKARERETGSLAHRVVSGSVMQDLRTNKLFYPCYPSCSCWVAEIRMFNRNPLFLEERFLLRVAAML